MGVLRASKIVISIIKGKFAIRYRRLMLGIHRKLAKSAGNKLSYHGRQTNVPTPIMHHVEENTFIFHVILPGTIVVPARESFSMNQ
jgi:hypothetical protein